MRAPQAQEPADSRFSNVVKEYLGGQVYTPRTGRRSKLTTVCLPTGVARSLALYSDLESKLRSHVYTRLLQAGLLIYLTSA